MAPDMGLIPSGRGINPMFLAHFRLAILGTDALAGLVASRKPVLCTTALTHAGAQPD